MADRLQDARRRAHALQALLVRVALERFAGLGVETLQQDALEQVAGAQHINDPEDNSTGGGAMDFISSLIAQTFAVPNGLVIPPSRVRRIGLDVSAALTRDVENGIVEETIRWRAANVEAPRVVPTWEGVPFAASAAQARDSLKDMFDAFKRRPYVNPSPPATRRPPKTINPRNARR